MKASFDRSKTLQEVEQHDWGEPTYHSSSVTTSHSLRRKPLNQFTVEDLRIMIGQQISLLILVPLALERLEDDPPAEGDYYRGDLLAMVLKIEEKFWTAFPTFLQRFRKVINRVRNMLPSLEEFTASTVQKLLEAAPQILK